MTLQPDKLFRDKLENFQRPAPLGAWDKIENNIAKPDRKIIWIRVAAGVAIVATAATLLWPAEKEEYGISKTNEQHAVEKKDSVTQPALKNETPKQEEAIVPQNYTAAIKKDQPVQKSVQPDQDSVAIPEIKEPETKELIAEVTPAIEKESVSTTIVYTAQEVNSKFLKKKLPPEATPESKDASGIQKLIGLAYAAKNSEAGLSDLRQKKDDLFALSFNKKKGEN